MRITFNIPDDVLKQARLRAVEEGKTVTDLLVEGLRIRLARSLPGRPLPISAATGGLLPGVEWGTLQPEGQDSQRYR